MKHFKKTTLLMAMGILIALAVVIIMATHFIFAQNQQNKNQATPQVTENKVAIKKIHRPVLLTGEVQTIDSQSILVPTSNTNPVPIRYFVPEGKAVKAGDVVLRIDSQADGQAEQVELQLVQTRENSYKEIADLEVKKIEAEKLLVQAKAAVGKAKIDASLPREQISALDYDKYQGEKERAIRDLEVKEKTLLIAKEAILHKQEDSVLAVKKLELQLAQSKVQKEDAEVIATRDGVIIHGYSSWSGNRIDEGGQAPMGDTAGRIVGNGQQIIEAWILEADYHFIKLDQKMSVHFDAIPNATLIGVVKRISSAPEAKTVWGKGRYFKSEIHLPSDHGLTLFAGMSALIEPMEPIESIDSIASIMQLKDIAKNNSEHADSNKKPLNTSSNKKIPKKHSEFTIEGEVLSRFSSAITTPSIRYVWQFNLVMLKPEGTLVKQGEPIAIFEVESVNTRLTTSKNSLNEKQRTLEKQILDHAEADKANILAVSEAKSNAEKAVRKASLPKELIKRIDYDKLIIERAQFEQLAQLTAMQLEAQQRARKAERKGLQTELDKIQNQIDQLEQGKKGLTVLADRSGMVLHVSNDEGEKTAVGSKVFVGSSVAILADPEKLYMTAKVPEAQVSQVFIGQFAKVTVPGANTTLIAKVSAMGQVFHSKSKSQPNIVRDIELEFETATKAVKPGSAVQVSFSTSSEKVKK